MEKIKVRRLMAGTADRALMVDGCPLNAEATVMSALQAGKTDAMAVLGNLTQHSAYPVLI